MHMTIIPGDLHHAAKSDVGGPCALGRAFNIVLKWRQTALWNMPSARSSWKAENDMKRTNAVQHCIWLSWRSMTVESRQNQDRVELSRGTWGAALTFPASSSRRRPHLWQSHRPSNSRVGSKTFKQRFGVWPNDLYWTSPSWHSWNFAMWTNESYIVIGSHRQ